MDPKVAKELEEWKVQELHEREAKLNKIMMEHKKKCMQRSPAIKFRQRYEMFKIAFIVALPVLAVWAFNDPYFQDRLVRSEIPYSLLFNYYVYIRPFTVRWK
jgi:quinol-cytochrome oxidoreductase complex cytochrome b subunit